MNSAQSMPSDEAMQRDVTRIALSSTSGAGFALAGSGAIREHGFTHRPTADIDLFTVMAAQDRFESSVDAAVNRLCEAGYDVEIPRRNELFARLSVTSGNHEVEVDFGIDWRSREPVTLGIGPVLAVEDAVGNKRAALYSRGESRDYLDVDAIRLSGRYTDNELLELASVSDPGFDAGMFAQRLNGSERIQPREVAVYGVSPDGLAEMTARSQQWARKLSELGK